MKTIFATLMLLAVAVSAFAQPQYFIGTADSSGYTVQNVFIDFATIDQPQSVGRIALNPAVMRGDSVIVRPAELRTVTVNFSAASADSILSLSVTGSVSLAQALVQRIAKYAVRDSFLGLPDAVTVKKLDAGVLTTISSYTR